MKSFIFLDLGDVIWDECPAQCHIRDLILRETSGVSISQYNSVYNIVAKASGERIKRVIQELNKDKVDDLVRKINEDFKKMSVSRYKKLHPIRDDVYSFLEKAKKNFIIIILANQPPKARYLIQEYSLEKYTDYIFLSSECGFKKPDFKLWEFAKKNVKELDFRNSIMIGNRKDLDLIPCAPAIRKTVLFKCPNAIIDEENCFPDFTPDLIVHSFSELLTKII